MPSSRKAVVQDAAGRPFVNENVPLPTTLERGTVLVKTSVVALNPSDLKMGAAFPAPGSIVGNDFVGIIVALGEGASDIKPGLAVGDLVCGALQGSMPDSPQFGCFTDYAIAHAGILIRLPDECRPSQPVTAAMGQPSTIISSEQAATLGTALATLTLAFWGESKDSLRLEGTPDNPTQAIPPPPVLVYGGSTATGTIATQLLKLSGYDPVVTCSPHNFPLCRSRGASAVFDYRSADVGAAIRRHTGNRMRYALDCISDARGVETCFAGLSRVGGRYVSLELVPDEMLALRRAVKPGFVLGVEVSGRGSSLGGGYGKKADPSKLDLGVRFFEMFERLLLQGKLLTHPVQKVEGLGGLDGVLTGLEVLKTGAISGRKLVVSIA
jgi:NADPH:quinone reductase-like Zn-dependent oxidoreductase